MSERGYETPGALNNEGGDPRSDLFDCLKEVPKPSEVVVAFLNGLLVEVKPEVEVETVEVVLE